MLTPVLSSRFKKDIRRMTRRGKDMNKLKTLLELLINEKPLPEIYHSSCLAPIVAGLLALIFIPHGLEYRQAGGGGQEVCQDCPVAGEGVELQDWSSHRQ